MRYRDTKPTYKKRYKSAALLELEKLANAEAKRRHPGIDPRYIPPRTYFDNNANALTKSVMAWLSLNHHHAERINTMGRPIDNRKIVTDVLGHKRQIGSVTWIKTAGQKGSSDISAVINGRAVRIEVKILDRQSQEQKEYQRQVEAAGGTYIIVRSFQAFYDWYQQFATK